MNIEEIVGKAKTPREKITGIDIWIAIHNPDFQDPLGKMVVDLACGHKALTKSRTSMVCPRCTEMLRRSLADGSEDYESFRAGRQADNMEWLVDDCRQLNELHLY